MPVVKKLAATKARTPKALGAVARQQLLLVNGLLDEVARNYVARLHREIAELIRALEKKQADPAFTRRELKDIRSLLKQIAHLQIQSRTRAAQGPEENRLSHRCSPIDHRPLVNFRF